jgi:hypothetical protein
MADFVFLANIDHYKHLLTTESDPQKIAIIRKLLAEEEAKLADFYTRNPRSKSTK